MNYEGVVQGIVKDHCQRVMHETVKSGATDDGQHLGFSMWQPDRDIHCCKSIGRIFINLFAIFPVVFSLASSCGEGRRSGRCSGSGPTASCPLAWPGE